MTHVFQLPITKKALTDMPSKERTLLLLFGHAVNEINVLMKLVIIASQGEAQTEIMGYVEAGQAMIFARLFIGKLHEAWELFKCRFQGDKEIALKYAPALNEEAKQSLDYLNKYFGKKNSLTEIRNQFSFHYKDEDQLIESNFHRLTDNEPWDFYLSEIRANSFYYASELVVMNGAIEIAGSHIGLDVAEPMRQQRAFESLVDISSDVAGHICTLFGDCIKDIMIAHLGDDLGLIEIDIPAAPKLSEISMPFFVDDSSAH